MHEQEVIDFCIEHNITIQQYFMMWVVASRDWAKSVNESSSRKYFKLKGPMLRLEEFEELTKRGLVINLNSEGSNPANLIIGDIGKEFVIDDEMVAELWDKYPATFPLSEGKLFIARAGGDKELLLANYKKRINNSPAKHKFVMYQLERFVRLVMAGKLNGRKLSDWIAEEIWDTVAEIQEEGGSFARNI